MEELKRERQRQRIYVNKGEKPSLEDFIRVMELKGEDRREKENRKDIPLVS